MCADDAHDAYQRGMEILLRHARRLDPDRLGLAAHCGVNDRLAPASAGESPESTKPLTYQVRSRSSQDSYDWA